MTIINTIIAGAGGGDEVEAYAVGDVKNAVAGDKVSLNFSADAAPGRETASIGNYYLTAQGNGTCYFDGEFLYATAYNGVGSTNASDCYIFRRQEDGSFAYLAGTLTGGLLAYPVTLRGLTYGAGGQLHQLIGGQSVDLPDSTSWPAFSFSPDGKLLRFGNALYLRNKEGLYVNTDNYVMSNAILLETEDGVEYPYIRFVDKNLSTLIYNVSNNTTRVVGTRSGFFTSNTYTVASVDLGGGCLIYFKDTNSRVHPLTLSYLVFGRYLKQEDGTYTLEEDVLATGNLKTALLKELNFNDRAYVFWMEILNDVLYVAAEPGGDYDSAHFKVKVLRFKVNKEAGTFEKIPSPFLDKTYPDVISFSEKGYVAKAASEGYAQEVLITSLAAPVEQPYVATEPLQNQFYPNQTLTGIVKENDNGILKVSTVEDPNNPPPAIPDEAGLGVTPFYGSTKLLPNGKVEGSLTVSDDASVSGFASSDGKFVYIDNPFLQILEGSEPVINTFEIVIPFTKGTSSDDWLFAFGNSIPFSGEALTNCFYVSVNNRLDFYFSSPYLAMPGTTTLTSNTKYWIKLAYDETEGYKILLSTNGSDYTVEASSATTTELDVGNYNYLIFGKCTTTTSTTYNWSGTIHFDGAYININGRQFWKGSKPDFGSVGVGYGYFRNTLSTPTDKYVAYEGGLLTEDNVFGGKATEMNVVLGRSAAGGSWTSDTKGFITTQDEAVVGANKKLSTPIYLWHDLSRITPAKPETIEAVVDLVANTVSLPIAWKNIEGVLYEYPNGYSSSAVDISTNTVEGSNNLYVTKTGDTCGMAISTSSPAGVDSSAVVGTVELNADGVITSYTPGE